VDIPVAAQVEFVVAEYRGAAGAVGEYVVAFVEQALFPEGLHYPPDGFHVTGVHGFVVVVEVYPAAQAADIVPPFFYIAQHRHPAGFVEFFHAVAFDVGLGIEAQFFFYEGFYRKAVAVPAEAPLHMPALHGLVAGDYVLDSAGYEMAEVGEARCEGGAVVENVLFPPGPLRYGLFEYFVFLPERQYFFFQFGKIYLGINAPVHRTTPVLSALLFVPLFAGKTPVKSG
jgi:hypothetical protein